jgi:hypothetical protein
MGLALVSYCDLPLPRELESHYLRRPNSSNLTSGFCNFVDHSNTLIRSMTDEPEFWESAFQKNQEMWGHAPSKSALWANDFFVRHSIKNILIPGIGYGRNAQLFLDNGMSVTGIEISRTAIDMAIEHYGASMMIHHGSVTNMPFDDQQYDGIFCYALIHLLDTAERTKLIRDCSNQLSETGYMVFTVISKDAATYGQGKLIGKDRYEQFGGARLFFYDTESIHAEFDEAGLIDITPIDETYPFFLIVCRK